MHREFLNALFPPRTQVLQVELLPLSIGHIVTLNQIGSRLLTGKDVRKLDLMVAVRVCSMRWKQCVEFVENQGDWASQFKEWGEALGDNIDWQAKTELFLEYIREGMKTPEFQTSEPNGGSLETMVQCGLGFVPHVRLTMMSRAGMTSDEAMDTPFRLAAIDAIGFREQDGKLRFIGQSDIEEFEGVYDAVDEYCRKLNEKGDSLCPPQS